MMDAFKLDVMEKKPKLMASLKVKPSYFGTRVVRLEATMPTASSVSRVDLSVDQARAVGEALLAAAEQVAAREDA